MPSHSDLTFLTNEEGNTLSDRFRTLIKDTQYFDILVGYFYTSGFWQIYPEIESSEKIRILIGISTSREVYETIQQSLISSHTELKNTYSEQISQEIESVKESEKIENELGYLAGIKPVKKVNGFKVIDEALELIRQKLEESNRLLYALSTEVEVLKRTHVLEGKIE